MHLLATTSTTLDEAVEPIDLGQPPGDVAVLSFADSDLAGLAAAWAMEREALPSVRLAHLRDLKHPMSVDLWIDRVAASAKVIVVRLLGGLDWWRYGVERLAALARERNIALAVLPGEDRDDPRLAEASTLPPDELATLLSFFREGGPENLRGLLRRLARHAGAALDAPVPRALPRCAGYLPEKGAVAFDTLIAALAPGQPVVPLVFYRSMLLAADTAPIDALCAALAERGLAAGRAEPQGCGCGCLRARRVAPARSGRDRHHDRVRGGRRAGRADAARRAGRAGAPGRGGDHQARRVAGERARARRRRSRHARGAARARWPRARRRRRVQAPAAGARGARLHGVRQSSGARASRCCCGARRRARAAAKNAARKTAHRRADAGLSGSARPHRLCGRPRRAGERGGAAAGCARRRLHGD